MGLLDFFLGDKKPEQGLLSNNQAYKDYAENAMVKGEPVLPFAEWQKKQKAVPVPPPPVKP